MPVYILGAALIGLLSGVTLPIALASLQSGYDPALQYISELGADKAPNAAIANWFGFLPAALSVFVVMGYFVLSRGQKLLIRIGAFLCLGIGIGYLGAFVFPCDAGCPAIGSFSQAMHNLSGLFEYGGAIFGLPLIALGLFQSGSKLRAGLTALAFFCVLAGFLMMMGADANTPIGLWQRLCDFTLFVWMFLLVYFSWRYPSQLQSD
ncbi:MAG: hypothetical protein CMK09_01440 [Ponticaulis sp.]|mgnify:CR=1 FL=1|nr:hypothetical protein [Ponticaulis sp.]|tara:strand:+ start:5690 stop:6310 length:621 start_codon:yes stop_codon:yes gene_type:complete